MTDDQSCWIGEYSSILKAATREGWLLPLLEAHCTPCEQDDAIRLLAWISVYSIEGGLPYLKLHWRNQKGQARFNLRTRRYSIGLPLTPGTNYGRLRVGLVLHEAAHVIDRRQNGSFGHQEKFRRILRRLVEDDWRKDNVRTGTLRDIYGRHRGPYSLLIGRAVPGKGGRIEQTTDHLMGPFSAEDAHVQALLLVQDPANNVTDVHIFSISEGQFTGAFYKRGVAYDSWAEMRSAADLDALSIDEVTEEQTDVDREETSVGVDPTDEGGLDVPDEREESALLPGGPEPLLPMAAPVDERVPAAAVPRHRPVRDVPPQEQAAAGRKRGTLLGVSADKADKWPASKGASLVREALVTIGTGITASDLAKRLAADLAAAGVEFPASLISRLKQGGFIQEVQS